MNYCNTKLSDHLIYNFYKWQLLISVEILGFVFRFNTFFFPQKHSTITHLGSETNANILLKMPLLIKGLPRLHFVPKYYCIIWEYSPSNWFLLFEDKLDPTSFFIINIWSDVKCYPTGFSYLRWCWALSHWLWLMIISRRWPRGQHRKGQHL